MNINTPESKAKLTKAIHAYLDASKAEARAKEAKKQAASDILGMLDGEKSVLWTTDNKSAYLLTATYGKTNKQLNADLIRAALGISVTPACYKESAPWNEIRITVKA